MESRGTVQSRSGTVHANGQDLYYEVHGEGRPLVMVMGIGYDSTLWTLAQVPALSQKFQVIIFDNRDAGRSSQATSSYTIADMADDTAALMDALSIKKAHVCGLSMGGMIAMELALRHPDRLDRMILSGAPGAPARAVFHPIATWNWVKANDRTGEAFAGQQFTWLFSGAFLRDRVAVQQTVAMLSSNPNPVNPQAYDRQARAFLAVRRARSVERRKGAHPVHRWRARHTDARARVPRGRRQDSGRQVRSDQGRRLFPRRADRAPRRLQRCRHEVSVLTLAGPRQGRPSRTGHAGGGKLGVEGDEHGPVPAQAGAGDRLVAGSVRETGKKARPWRLVVRSRRSRLPEPTT